MNTNTIQQITVNPLPAPTWNHLHMNSTEVALPPLTGCCAVATELPDGVVPGGALPFAPVTGGMGETMNALPALGEEAVYRTAAGARVQAPLRLQFTHQNGQNTLNDIALYAAEGSEMTVIMSFCDGSGENVDGCGSDNAPAGLMAIRTRLHAGKNARLRLVQVQMLGEGTRLLNDIGGDCEDGGQIELIQLVLGGGDTAIGCRADLAAPHSGLTASIGYLRSGARLDMNYIANHLAPHTTSEITAGGVLREGTAKLFRGTIDFRRGSAGSRGNEKEDVLLLSDDVVNQTIPLILCKEEDVEGNHGATIGQLDEELLFYLAARGFTREEAYALMAKARIDAVCRKIPDEKTQQTVQAYLCAKNTTAEEDAE